MPREWFRVYFRLGMSQKQSVRIFNFTIIDAHGAPGAQGVMHSTVEVRSAAGVLHRRCAAPELDRKIRSGDSEAISVPGCPERLKQTKSANMTPTKNMRI